MRVAVTGASGFIGRHLVESPVHDWVLLSRRVLPDGNSASVTTDYSTESLLDALSGVDAVVHLASAKIGRETGDCPSILLANLELAHQVFDACVKSGVRRVVHISSRMVYGPNDPMPWQEGADAHPATLYGLSKLCSEKMAGVLFAHVHHTGAIHLRVPQVIGVPGSGADEHVITTFLRRANAGENLEVTRNVRRQYLYIADAVAAILHCLDADVTEGVFNVAMPQGVSTEEAAQEISGAFGAASRIVSRGEMHPEALQDVFMDVTKATSEIGFTPSWSFEDAVSDIARTMGEVQRS